MSRLVLDRMYLIHMLGDDQFYEECPAFVPLREVSQAAYQAFMADTRAGRCNSCDLPASIILPLRAFIAEIDKLHQENPHQLACVREYLNSRKKYNVTQVVLIYRRVPESKPRRLIF